MNDEKPKDEVIEEKKESKGYDYAKDSKKSMRVIAKEVQDEQRAERQKELDAKPAESEPAKEPEPPKTEEPKEDKTIHNQKLVEDAAEKAAQKAADKLQEQLAKVEESKQLSAQEKVEKKEDLKAKWAREGRTPSSYEEIYEEAKRDALEETKRWIEERESQKAQELAEQTRAQQEKQAERQKQEDEYRSSVERMTMDELEEMKGEGINLSDDERKALFQKGLEINTDRLAKGQPPIISISRIYHNHYKPGLAQKRAQPPGADAPIAGSHTAPAESATEKAYVYARDHGKSWRQLIMEAAKGKR